MKLATFGAGCFWCIEPIFSELKGVSQVLPGYMGGSIKNPSYREVCTGRTGHAEVIQMSYDSDVLAFDTLLEVLFTVHDPTTLNRQGNDRGTQYRSAIFYHDLDQKTTATQVIQDLETAKAFSNPIVTEVTEASEFYVADESHLNYYRNNPDQPYCSMLIRPKIEKFKSVFHSRLK